VTVPVAAHRGWVALVGSVGQPRDGDPRAMYALLDAAQARLAFHRVAYDHAGAAAAVRAAGFAAGFRRTTGAGTMTRLQEGAVIDGFLIGARVHAGAMAELYRVRYDGDRPDPGFPMVMTVAAHGRRRRCGEPGRLRGGTPDAAGAARPARAAASWPPATWDACLSW
jgi:hypothetical protein